MPKKRIDTQHDAADLTDNPFAALKGMAGEAAPGAEPASEPADNRPYSVERSRKGGWRIAIEKRGGGKVVTILSGVEGDASALLAALKKHCATGGRAYDGAIELQGDHRQRIADFLDR